MIDNEKEREREFIEDEMGKWEILEGDGRRLVEPSAKYFEQIGAATPDPIDPTNDDYWMDMDFRLSMIELGL